MTTRREVPYEMVDRWSVHEVDDGGVGQEVSSPCFTEHEAWEEALARATANPYQRFTVVRSVCYEVKRW